MLVYFSPSEKGLFDLNTRFHSKGLFWLKAFFFLIKKKNSKAGGKGHFCKTFFFLKKKNLFWLFFIRNTSAGGLGSESFPKSPVPRRAWSCPALSSLPAANAQQQQKNLELLENTLFSFFFFFSWQTRGWFCPIFLYFGHLAPRSRSGAGSKNCPVFRKEQRTAPCSICWVSQGMGLPPREAWTCQGWDRPHSTPLAGSGGDKKSLWPLGPSQHPSGPGQSRVDPCCSLSPTLSSGWTLGPWWR